MHVDENTITAYVDGGLSPAEVSQFRQHLDGCPDCVALVACMVKDRGPDVASTVLMEIANGSHHRPSLPRLPQSLLPAGASVGPYVIERLLGAGAMGVVYAARDPRLDRVVALKLIRQEPGVLKEALAERLRRESKALARLSHPNVTVVYELGAAGDEIFVAMEYVPGTNLRAWWRDQHPSSREILAMFARAGRGLAAAHAAGLVHRDFKPDNVLIAADGRVKVTDFGLARLAGEVLAAPEGELAAGSTDHTLTMTGAIVGTPAYMAPEQFGGDSVDARADQFAFCVSLYEALYGERPFRAGTFELLRIAVLAGRVEPPRSARVSSRVRRALVRGLAADPDKRFAAMDDLLAAIAPRRGRVVLAALGLGVPAGVALAAVLFAQPSVRPCRGAAIEIAPVWNPARRDSARAAFLATRAPGAEQTWSAVERDIEAYVSGWVIMHGGACVATRVHREQSEAVLDLRMMCLERGRSLLDALVTVFAHADADVVAHAREAMASLGDVKVCGNVEALSRRVLLPSAPPVRVRFAGMRVRVDLVRALVDVAHYKAALVALDTLDTEVPEFPALDAEASYLRGKALGELDQLDAAEKSLFRALVLAQSVRADDYAAHAAIDLADVVGVRDRRADEGLRWADLAAATIASIGGDDALSAQVASVRGSIFDGAGRLADGEKAHRQALAAVRRRAPGGILEDDVVNALGTNLALQGKLDEAVSMLRQSLAGRERSYGPTHPLTAAVRVNLANVLGSLHHYDEAVAQYRQALVAQEALLGAGSIDVTRVRSNLGQTLQEWGRLPEAETELERALASQEKLLGPDNPQVAHTLANLGYLSIDQRRYKQAMERFTRADAIVSKALGAEHRDRSDSLEGLGLTWLGLGRPASAIEPLEHALALHVRRGSDPVALAGLQADLARALWASGRDRKRARELAAGARKVLVEAGEAKQVADLDTTLNH